MRWPRAAVDNRGASRFAILLLCSALGACAPMSPMLPFHMSETAEVLRRGKFSFNVTGGGGGLSGEGSGTGFALRVRAGLGREQELGVEAGAVYASTGTIYVAEGSKVHAPWSGNATALGAKLTWKMAPLPWLAVMAGAGGTSSNSGVAAGGELGLVVSSSRALGGLVRPYAGARGAFALPVGRDLDVAGGPTAALVLPVGLSLEVTRFIRVFAEAGALVGWSNIGTSPDRYEHPENNPYPGIFAPAQHGGGYGALGVTFLLGRNKDQKAFLEGQQVWMR